MYRIIFAKILAGKNEMKGEEDLKKNDFKEFLSEIKD